MDDYSKELPQVDIYNLGNNVSQTSDKRLFTVETLSGEGIRSILQGSAEPDPDEELEESEDLREQCAIALNQCESERSDLQDQVNDLEDELDVIEPNIGFGQIAWARQSDIPCQGALTYDASAYFRILYQLTGPIRYLCEFGNRVSTEAAGSTVRIYLRDPLGTDSFGTGTRLVDDRPDIANDFGKRETIGFTDGTWTLRGHWVNSCNVTIIPNGTLIGQFTVSGGLITSIN